LPPPESCSLLSPARAPRTISSTAGSTPPAKPAKTPSASVCFTSSAPAPAKSCTSSPPVAARPTAASSHRNTAACSKPSGPPRLKPSSHCKCLPQPALFQPCNSLSPSYPTRSRPTPRTRPQPKNHQSSTASHFPSTPMPASKPPLPTACPTPRLPRSATALHSSARKAPMPYAPSATSSTAICRSSAPVSNTIPTLSRCSRSFQPGSPACPPACAPRVSPWPLSIASPSGLCKPFSRPSPTRPASGSCVLTLHRTANRLYALPPRAQEGCVVNCV